MEFQISVSVNGLFLFRTDWDTDETRVATAAEAISTAMPLAKVHVVSRSRAMKSVPVHQFLEER